MIEWNIRNKRKLLPILALSSAVALCGFLQNSNHIRSLAILEEVESYSPKAKEDGDARSLSATTTTTTTIQSATLLDACGRVVVSPGDGNPDGSNVRSYNNRSRFCSELHAHTVEQCSKPDANVVLSRGDHYDNQSATNDVIRPFSLLPLPASLTDDIPLLLPKCENVSDYLQSIKFGTRKWEGDDDGNYNHSDPIALERHPSRFVPSKCYVPFVPPSPERSCDIMNDFSHVILQGDSLSRHIRQTLVMIMRGQWINGAVVTKNSETRKSCTCDGQYSESEICREVDGYFDRVGSPPLKIPLSHGNEGESSSRVCSNVLLSSEEDTANNSKTKSVKPFQFGSRAIAGKVPWDQIDCTKPDYRGLFLFVQGGLHLKCNPRKTYKELVEPILRHSKYQQCVQYNKVKLVVGGLTAQSRSYDSKYPHQSREKAISFNNKLNRFISSSGHPGSQDYLFMDWWNLTANAPTSDGLHSLMDVNLAKASHLLELMEMLSPRNRTTAIVADH